MPLPTPPLLPGWPLLGNALAFSRDPVEVFRKGYETLGPIFSIRLGPKRAVVLIGPEYQQFFFSKTDDILSMREVYTFVIPMFGEVTLAARQAAYQEQRAVLQPAFQGRRMEGYLDVMVQEALAWLDALGKKGRFDLYPTFEQLSMYIAAGALLGRDFRCRMGQAFWSHYRDVAAGMEFVLPTNLPLPRFRRRDRAKRALFAMLRPIIAERRAQPGAHQDFMQTLAEARYPDGRLVPEDTIIGMILILVFAAYETTAAQMSWALVLLLQHPAYLAQVREELAANIGSKPEAVGLDVFKNLHRLEWAIKESTRLRPITTMLWRHTAQAYDLGGYHIPERWVSMVCPPVAHLLPDVFEQPHRYDPERFDPQRNGARSGAMSLINFGGGYHKCLGLHFAYYEMKVVLGLLLRHYDLHLSGGTPASDYSTGICRPQAPYLVAYRRQTD